MSGASDNSIPTSATSAESGDVSELSDTHARDLKLWRQRSSLNSDSDRPDANLIALVNSAGNIDNVLSKSDPDGLLPGNVVNGGDVEELWPGEIGERVRRNIRKALQARQAYSNQVVDDDGHCFEFIYVPQGRDRVMLIARDASASQARIEELADLAFLDSDSGLPNRDWLIDELGDVIHRIRLRQGRGALICLDIEQDEDLKATHGHEAYRVILATVASRLVRTLRGANQRDEDDDERYSAVARIGETQFAIVLPDIETGDDAVAVAGRMAELMQSPIMIDGHEYKLNVSVGIALYPQDGERASELLSNGIVALQEARFSHTSHHKFHSGTVRMRALERQDLVVELDAALRDEEFELHFLPILKQPGNTISTVEVLLRWPRPLFASRPIREVIKAAEYTGLIVPIGEWVLSAACRQLSEWRNAGHEDLRLAVNISAQEFSREDVAERLGQILAEHGVHGEDVDMEITEHLLFRDAMRSFPSCRGFKDIGTNVVIDDYGTGICSFDYLAGSPVDGVKIHQKFTALVDQSAPSRAACAAIIAMAHELGLRVTAEGVETGQQADVLAGLGCDHLQGFLYCEPMSSDAMSKLLEEGPMSTAGASHD